MALQQVRLCINRLAPADERVQRNVAAQVVLNLKTPWQGLRLRTSSKECQCRPVAKTKGFSLRNRRCLGSA
jgi:hypothetical protein